MKIALHDEFTIKTILTREEALEVLLTQIGGGRYTFGILDQSLYYGDISRDDFRIVRGVSKSFRPLITGRFLPGQSGTSISVRMTLAPGTSAFLIVLSGILGLILLALVCCGGEVETKHLWEITALASFIFFLTYALFWDYAKEGKKMLIDIFRNAEEKAGRFEETPAIDREE